MAPRTLGCAAVTPAPLHTLRLATRKRVPSNRDSPAPTGPGHPPSPSLSLGIRLRWGPHRSGITQDPPCRVPLLPPSPLCRSSPRAAPSLWPSPFWAEVPAPGVLCPEGAPAAPAPPTRLGKHFSPPSGDNPGWLPPRPATPRQVAAGREPPPPARWCVKAPEPPQRLDPGTPGSSRGPTKGPGTSGPRVQPWLRPSLRVPSPSPSHTPSTLPAESLPDVGAEPHDSPAPRHTGSTWQLPPSLPSGETQTPLNVSPQEPRGARAPPGQTDLLCPWTQTLGFPVIQALRGNCRVGTARHDP